MPRFLKNEHKLHDLISFCVNAVVLAAAQILQESWRLLFEFTARFVSLLEMSDHMELAEWLVQWAPKQASWVRCSTRSSS